VGTRRNFLKPRDDSSHELGTSCLEEKFSDVLLYASWDAAASAKSSLFALPQRSVRRAHSA